MALQLHAKESDVLLSQVTRSDELLAYLAQPPLVQFHREAACQQPERAKPIALKKLRMARAQRQQALPDDGSCRRSGHHKGRSDAVFRRQLQSVLLRLRTDRDLRRADGF